MHENLSDKPTLRYCNQIQIRKAYSDEQNLHRREPSPSMLLLRPNRHGFGLPVNKKYQIKKNNQSIIPFIVFISQVTDVSFEFFNLFAGCEFTKKFLTFQIQPLSKHLLLKYFKIYYD